MRRHVVDFTWLNERLSRENVVIADCRFTIGAPDDGEKAYRKDHIVGAVYFHLDQDLSGVKKRHGGRHPLPDASQFAAKASEKGIGSDTTVVAYDDQNGAMAARLWWLLRYFGHRKAFILDGNYRRWKKEGYPVSNEIPIVQPRRFVVSTHDEMIVNRNEVLQKCHTAHTAIVDSRAPERFRGEKEPIDPVAGHIPGAVNLFWKENYDNDGRLKKEDELKQRFHGLTDRREVIVYCGSGVTACANVLAMTEAGLHNVKLYPGSWSDWCSYSDSPIAAGESS